MCIYTHAPTQVEFHLSIYFERVYCIGSYSVFVWYKADWCTRFASIHALSVNLVLPTSLLLFRSPDFSVNCTFEYGLCGFFESRTDDFDWIWTNQSSPSAGTGPDRDHTSGHGYYVYIETSQPRKPGDKAVLSTGPQVRVGNEVPGGVWVNENGCNWWMGEKRFSWWVDEKGFNWQMGEETFS